VRRLPAILLALVLGILVAGCGSGHKKRSEKSDLTKKVQAACTAAPLKVEPKLPPSFPPIAKLTYTKQTVEGATNVVEGYFKGNVDHAHDVFLTKLASAGYSIVSNELKKHDSEISWQGEARIGQVALREQCGHSGKTYVRITNRPG
jgi:hypothetical protein